MLHFYDKCIMFERKKKKVTDKPWQDMFHDKTIMS